MFMSRTILRLTSSSFFFEFQAAENQSTDVNVSSFIQKRKLKSGKAAKAAKAAKSSPKVSKSSINFADQVFYSDDASELLLKIRNEDDIDDAISIADANTGVEGVLYYMIDLGVLRGSDNKVAKDTTALVEASFTTSIKFGHDTDDDYATSDSAAKVSLSILAYSGCDSADSCDVANVNPSPLIPPIVEMDGWEREIFQKEFITI